MAYSNNPNLPRARAIAMQLLIRDQLPLFIVANRWGVHRSTIYRWKKKWDRLNQYVRFDNPSRPHRTYSLKNKLLACRWQIVTESAVPHTNPRAICDAVIDRILELREQLKRCAEVIWHYLTHTDGIVISLSSVHRILRRHHIYDGHRKNRVRANNPERPHVTRPGELVETDTIHYICPETGRRRYVYTVIDLYTRMTHAEIHPRIGPGRAAAVVLRAQATLGFSFCLVQSDNGPEYSRYFEQTLARHSIQTRHTRLGRP